MRRRAGVFSAEDYFNRTGPGESTREAVTRWRWAVRRGSVRRRVAWRRVVRLIAVLTAMLKFRGMLVVGALLRPVLFLFATGGPGVL